MVVVVAVVMVVVATRIWPQRRERKRERERDAKMRRNQKSEEREEDEEKMKWAEAVQMKEEGKKMHCRTRKRQELERSSVGTRYLSCKVQHNKRFVLEQTLLYPVAIHGCREELAPHVLRVHHCGERLVVGTGHQARLIEQRKHTVALLLGHVDHGLVVLVLDFAIPVQNTVDGYSLATVWRQSQECRHSGRLPSS